MGNSKEGKITGGIMARKTQISKEVILENAFQLLIREGYANINIVALAKEIGCSTQPIAWHFGNMDGLKTELLSYSLEFLKNYYTVEGKDAGNIMESIAHQYIKLAMEYPNLYKYIYISEHDGEKMMEIANSLRAKNKDRVLQLLQKEYEIAEEQVKKYVMNFQIYVHGIASFIVTNVRFLDKETIIQMIHEANQAFLLCCKQKVKG